MLDLDLATQNVLARLHFLKYHTVVDTQYNNVKPGLEPHGCTVTSKIRLFSYYLNSFNTMGVSIFNGKLKVTKSFSHQFSGIDFHFLGSTRNFRVQSNDPFSESIPSIPI